MKMPPPDVTPHPCCVMCNLRVGGGAVFLTSHFTMLQCYNAPLQPLQGCGAAAQWADQRPKVDQARDMLPHIRQEWSAVAGD